MLDRKLGVYRVNILLYLIGLFGLYRMKVRDTVENPDSTFTPVPATITPSGLELDPTTEPIEENNQIIK